jgi:rhodanese-related sulfurtransferase
MKLLAAIAFATLIATAFVAVSPASSADTAPRITKEQLLPLIGNPDVVIVDARQPKDWDASQSKIKGAIRLDPSQDLQAALSKLPKEKTIVFYCS